MKVDKSLFKFPQYLPNDLEGLIFHYPRKFPTVIPYYEETAEKYFADPDGFKDFCDKSYEELRQGFLKIKSDYDKGNQNDLEFLLSIDKRLHKLYAFRFWVINYLMADGPVHEYYVDKIKYYSRKLVDISEVEAEEYEAKILEIERDLMQSDYADLYLENALESAKMMKLLREDERWNNVLRKVGDLIGQNDEKNNPAIYRLLDPIVDMVVNNESDMERELYRLLEISISQSNFRKTRLPIYHMIVQAIEFEEENKKLEERRDELTQKINSLLEMAQKKFSKKEYEELALSYKMAKNLAMSKDIMGNIDRELLPFWLGDVLVRIVDCLVKMGMGCKKQGLGPGGLFYFIVWYLPDKYKKDVFKIDSEPFLLEEI